MDNLARAGFAVAKSFDHLRQTAASRPPSIDIDNLLHAEYQRYQLWAYSLGITARGHASLDYRLAIAPRLRALVSDLLEELVLTLQQTLEVVSGQRRPLDEAIEELHPTSMIISLGNADSDDESDASTSEDDDVTSGQTLTASHQPSELEVRSEAANDIINKLFGLAFKIRSPSNRQTLRKPFEKTDLAIDAYMLGAEKLRLDDLVRHMQSQHRKQPMSEIVLSDPETKGLIERFARANMRRRQLFLHWQRQSNSASSCAGPTSVDEALESKPQLAQSQTLPYRPSTQHSIKNSQRTPETQLVENNLFAPGPRSVESHVSRTPTAHVMLDGDDDDDDENDLNWPECPTELPDGDFKCPYCMHLCPDDYRKPAAWKTHLVRDVSPYVCSYLDCDEQHVIFETHKDWMEHEISVHELRWTCADHGDQLYTSKQYQEHTIQHHNSTFRADARDGQIEKLKSEAAGLSERVCPLCTAFFNDMAKMRSHMQHHLEKIALITLPRSTGLEKISGDGPVKSHAAAAAKDHSRDGDFDGQLSAFTVSNYRTELPMDESDPPMALPYQVADDGGHAAEDVEFFGKAPPEMHSDRLASLHKLATAYRSNGQTAEAIECLERIVEIKKQNLDQIYPYRLISERELATAYISNGQTAEAIQLLEHAVKIYEQTVSVTHPDRLASQRELAIAYGSKGQTTEAMQLLEHIVESQKHDLYEANPYELIPERDVAKAYGSIGWTGEAIRLLEHIVKVQQQKLLDAHPSRLSSERELAKAYGSNQRTGEAIQLLEQVVEVQKHSLAEEDLDRLTSERELANAYKSNRRTAEAMQLLMHIVEVCKREPLDTRLDRLVPLRERAEVAKYHLEQRIRDLESSTKEKKKKRM